MQRLTSSGILAWNPNGLYLSAAAGIQRNLQGAPDGAGGALFCWMDGRFSDNDIYVQRVEPTGGYTWWSDHGARACVETGEQTAPNILGDGYGGAYLCWVDDRADSWDSTDIYVQHVSPAGANLWGETGMAAGGRDGHQGPYGIDMVPDGQGGIIVVWNGYDGLDALSSDLYGQRFDLNGNPKWNYYSAHPLFLGSGDQENPQAVTHPNGGVVTVFLDEKYLIAGDVTVKYTDHHGYPGDARPIIAAVTDFPQDQGGVLIVDWERSYLDEPVNVTVEDYTLWKRLAGIDREGDNSQDFEAVTEASGLCESKVADLLREGWAYVATVDAVTHDLYSFDAPSYGDSTETEVIWSAYMVIARASDTVYWESLPSYGFSVDNLAPGAPLNLTAFVNDHDVDLDWTPSAYHDEDLAHYKIYRSDMPDFETDLGTYRAATTDTIFVDINPEAGLWYSRVTALDLHGNAGDDSNEVFAELITGVGDEAPSRFALHGNWPNPFNPVTRIAFDLPTAGAVGLKLYDTAGRLIVSLVDEQRPAGRYEETWRGMDLDSHPVSSGVYLALLSFGDERASHRLVLLK